MVIVTALGWTWAAIGTMTMVLLIGTGIRNWWRRAQDDLDFAILAGGETPDHTLRLRPASRVGRGAATRSGPTNRSFASVDECDPNGSGTTQEYRDWISSDHKVALDTPTSQLDARELQDLLLPDWDEARSSTPRDLIGGMPMQDPTIYEQATMDLATLQRAIDKAERIYDEN